MSTQHTTKEQDDLDSASLPMTKVTINMPVVLHNELRKRARNRGISVTELMRRAVALDKLVFEDGATVIVRDPETNETKTLHLL